MIRLLTNSGTHVVCVWIESVLNWCSSSLGMVVGVLNHVARLRNLFLLEYLLIDVHVSVVFKLHLF